MRSLDKKEIEKRGCDDCADVDVKKFKNGTLMFCKHGVCPYHELDNIKRSYKREYLNKFDNSSDLLRSILMDN